MKDVSALTKDELQEYAQSGVDFPAITLELKKGVESLRKQVAELQPKEAVLPVAESLLAEPAKQATHIKNKKTGRVFLKTQSLIDHLLEDGLLCDSEGKPV